MTDRLINMIVDWLEEIDTPEWAYEWVALISGFAICALLLWFMIEYGRWLWGIVQP